MDQERIESKKRWIKIAKFWILCKQDENSLFNMCRNFIFFSLTLIGIIIIVILFSISFIAISAFFGTFTPLYVNIQSYNHDAINCDECIKGIPTTFLLMICFAIWLVIYLEKSSALLKNWFNIIIKSIITFLVTWYSLYLLYLFNLIIIGKIIDYGFKLNTFKNHTNIDCTRDNYENDCGAYTMFIMNGIYIFIILILFGSYKCCTHVVKNTMDKLNESELEVIKIQS